MKLLDGLDGGQKWSNAEKNGSRTITVAEGAPTVTLKLVSPTGSYSIGTRR
jgi:hypothetical protein